jgi:polysaccharide export outer membrane protein
MRKTNDEEGLVTISTGPRDKASAATRVTGTGRGLHQTETSPFIRICSVVCLLLLVGCYDPNRQAQFFPQATPAGRVPPTELDTVQLTNALTAELLRPATEPFTLGPGDGLEIEVLGDPTSRTLTTVGPDGRVYFHLLPGVDVWGKTLSEARAQIEKGLSEYMREQPQVSISLRGVGSRRVWVLGRFQGPGVYPMNGNMTLLEAISLAGGPASLSGNLQSNFAYSSEELADLRRAFLVRKGQLVPVDFHRLLKQGDLSQNIYLQPDDFIYFPPSSGREVYVLGAVGTPRAVPYNDELTLASAIANAQGTVKDAYWNQVAVVRGSLSNPRIAIIDYKAIIQGRAPDIRLEPQDIVFVPLWPHRHLKRYLNIILDTFVSSVAINEGSRAVLGEEDASTTGVIIPLSPRPAPTAPPPVAPAR